MADRIVISEADLAKEFRLRHVRGSAVDAVTNPALRICLTTCAELRKSQRESQQPEPDLKRLAAGDTD
jgi:hypothetical protein